MKRKQTLIFGLILILIQMGLNGFTQERVNREMKVEQQVLSKKIKNAVGWVYDNKHGAWVSAKNVLIENNIEPINIYFKSFLTSNFNYLQTMKVSYEDEIFYVLLHNKWDGYYVYPTINLDWIPYEQVLIYFYSEKEYNKLQNFILNYKLINNGEILELNPLRYSFVSKKCDNGEILNEIQNNLNIIFKHREKYKQKENEKNTFYVMKNNNESVRFHLPKTHTQFNERYFETSLTNFMKIVISK